VTVESKTNEGSTFKARIKGCKILVMFAAQKSHIQGVKQFFRVGWLEAPA
jgi:hypothetical protein